MRPVPDRSNSAESWPGSRAVAADPLLCRSVRNLRADSLRRRIGGHSNGCWRTRADPGLQWPERQVMFDRVHLHLGITFKVEGAMEKGVRTRIGRVAVNRRVPAIGTDSLTQVPGRVE
jgi:hypothetical protein